MSRMIHFIVLIASIISSAYCTRPALGHLQQRIPTTLEGPFKPHTEELPKRLHNRSLGLPENDPRIKRKVKGFCPEQIALTLSISHDSIWVSWITGEYQIGKNIKPCDATKVKSVVRYGTSRSSLTKETTGNYSVVYSQLYPFPDINNYTSGIIHRVRLTGLEPNKTYYYTCGDPTLENTTCGGPWEGMSHVLNFTTMPASRPNSYPKRIAVLGDPGLSYNTTSTVDHMNKNDPDLILVLGDVSYADIYFTNGTEAYKQNKVHGMKVSYQPRWDFWGRFMEPTVSRVPMMMVQGNHEIETQARDRQFAAFESRFAYPNSESGSPSPFYYSFNAGGIHFIVLGAYSPYNESYSAFQFLDEQHKWLENDLCKVNREVTPWLIATWHPAWYNTYTSHYREAECMKVVMEDLLFSYGVDVILNGHVHAYERSNRVYNYECNECGPVHITVGDGGNESNRALEHADDNCDFPEEDRSECAHNFSFGPAKGKFCWDRQPDYSAYRDASFGHGILEVKNDTYALWTWYRNQDDCDETGDQIYIVRQPEKCPVKPKKEDCGDVRA